MVPDPDAEYRLFDRVVNIRESFTVPLGLRGTVIGIKGGQYVDPDFFFFMNQSFSEVFFFFFKIFRVNVCFCVDALSGARG